MKLAVIIIAIFCSGTAYALDIASCSEPSGKGYFPEIGLVGKKASGWSDEKITGGITKLSKVGEKEYDLLFVDASKQITSARDEGGRVMLLNKGDNVFSILVVYPGTTAEVYMFLKDNSGRLEYVNTISRAGDGVLVAKAAVMRGGCTYINFDAL